MSTDKTLQSIADVLAANEQHMVPRDPNQPELHWRDISGLPAARPVPSPEDRMAAARTDREYADRIPAPRPMPTDRTNSHHRDLHQHIAGLENDLRSQTRAVLEVTAERDRQRQELGAAGEVLAVVRDAAERIDRALAVYDTTPGESEPEHFAYPDGTCAPDCPGCSTPPSSVPPRRMQGEPLTAAQLGEMSIQANVEQVQAIHHHARGYADAIAALRDDSRYMDWWSSTGVKPAGPLRQHLADYLETVGPDGIDVTAPAVAISGNPCCGGDGVEASCELCRP